MSSVPAAAAAATEGPLSRFELHGYCPSPDLSEDLTYMDLVMIITRSSQLRQGSMGCLLVRPMDANPADGEERTTGHTAPLSRIIAAATNTSLFHPHDSDVHAEINAIGQVAKRSQSQARPPVGKNVVSTQGATAYITMPPCKRCFGALYACGISQIVSRVQHPDVLVKAAAKVGIEMRCLTREELTRQQTRLGDLFAKNGGGGAEDGRLDHENAKEVAKQRKRRKEEKHARKVAKIARNDLDSNGD